MSHPRPLAGRRVVVTRGVDKADRLPALLEEAGAAVVKVPLIEPRRLVDDDEVRDAVARLRAGGAAARPWMVLTSETGVEIVVAAVGAAGLEGVAAAVVGPATAEALLAHGVAAELVASAQEAVSLAAQLSERDVAGVRVLVVAASGGRGVVAPALAAAGAGVEVIEAYQSVMPEGSADLLRDAFAGGGVDAITFTSGSTVRHCASALPDPPTDCTAVCIGPVTAQAAHDAGWTTVITATEHTAAGVVAAMVEHLAATQPLP